MESKKAATFLVEFAPHELGSFNHELQLRVNNNPFEQYRVALTGTGHSLVWLTDQSSVAHVIACFCYAAWALLCACVCDAAVLAHRRSVQPVMSRISEQG